VRLPFGLTAPRIPDRRDARAEARTSSERKWGPNRGGKSEKEGGEGTYLRSHKRVPNLERDFIGQGVNLKPGKRGNWLW